MKTTTKNKNTKTNDKKRTAETIAKEAMSNHNINGRSEVNDIQNKSYRMLLDRSLKFLTEGKISEFPSSDLEKMDDEHLLLLMKWIEERPDSKLQDLLLVEIVNSEIRDEKQMWALENELTIRFIEEEFPYREEHYGNMEYCNKYLLEHGIQNLTEPYYSTHEIRMEFIKNKGLYEHYVSFLLRQIRDVIYKNSNGKNELTLKKGIENSWFLEDERSFVGL